jgi:hypothetical protein
MKQVYIAANLMEAQVAIDLLATQSIKAHIFNANAASGVGELAATQMWPEVWVEDDVQARTALQLLRELQTTDSSENKLCPRCGEINPRNFLSCWSCGNPLN